MNGVASPLRGFVRLTAYLLWTFACIPVQAILLLVKSPLRSTFPMAYHRTCMEIIGIDVKLLGKRCRDHPVLFAVNHSSYLDITLLGALMPVSFVAKAEVAKWPLYGVLAKLQRTVFVERNPRKVHEQRAEMVARLERGHDLVLFPEGTSSDGNGVLPFKSALLSAAEIEIRGKQVVVQPISIAYTHLDGIPLGRHFRPFYTWFGDMEMASHIWQMIALGKLRVVIEFHPPLTVAEAGSRKILAQRCWNAVACGVSSAIVGRPQSRELVTAA
ncbi:MAG TPA: lysophospholipid acyltransferase family protein [Alphaproteobacteria bacterium]|nr:lysophospholipid acyltransferase family protein [Alphaproteobacteria bacterium]